MRCAWAEILAQRGREEVILVARHSPQPTGRMILWQNSFLIILPNHYSAFQNLFRFTLHALLHLLRIIIRIAVDQLHGGIDARLHRRLFHNDFKSHFRLVDFVLLQIQFFFILAQHADIDPIVDRNLRLNAERISAQL